MRYGKDFTEKELNTRLTIKNTKTVREDFHNIERYASFEKLFAKQPTVREVESEDYFIYTINKNPDQTESRFVVFFSTTRKLVTEESLKKTFVFMQRLCLFPGPVKQSKSPEPGISET